MKSPLNIKVLQLKLQRAGYYHGTVDGFWGPVSIKGCQAYLRSLAPANCAWPAADNASVRACYGAPGDEGNLVPITFPFPLFYEGKKVTRGRCHKRVADSLLRVLTAIGDTRRDREAVMDAVTDYSGVFNFRPMRGGTALSMHAWGIAIDIDADDNGNHVPWPTHADMPFEIIEAFAREGWTSAAAFWGRDAMHFQATAMPA